MRTEKTDNANAAAVVIPHRVVEFVIVVLGVFSEVHIVTPERLGVLVKPGVDVGGLLPIAEEIRRSWLSWLFRHRSVLGLLGRKKAARFDAGGQVQNTSARFTPGTYLIGPSITGLRSRVL